MAKESTLSFTVMLIIIAILGLFVGYLLGNWVIQVVTGGTPQTTKLVEDKIIEEEIEVGDEEEVNPSTSQQYTEQSVVEEQQQEVMQDQLQGEVYAVQVGAFNNINNARKLKEELSGKGFQVILTEEAPPYKVLLGASTDREEAERLEEEVESMGYDAFITH